jgi:hypothetical protein
MNSSDVAKRMATIYLRKQSLYTHAYSLTTNGVWMLTEPVLKMNEAANDADIGSAIRAALDRSRTNVPHPKSQSEWAEILKPLLEEAGVKSWARFVHGASCVIVKSGDQELLIIPTNKSRGQFEHELASAIALQNTTTSASDVGAAVRELLQ